MGAFLIIAVAAAARRQEFSGSRYALNNQRPLHPLLIKKAIADTARETRGGVDATPRQLEEMEVLLRLLECQEQPDVMVCGLWVPLMI